MQFLDGTTYKISDSILYQQNAIPLTFWTVTTNFGDLLSPYLIEKMTGIKITSVQLKPGYKRKFKYLRFRSSPFSYLAIGSIIGRANDRSIVWGSGAFGTEDKNTLNGKATYLAVRGPLTRNLLRISGIACPEIYGDPALLLPKVFHPQVKKKYKVGVILRWAETKWNELPSDSQVKKIYLGTDNIEGVLTEILECERIVSSSLHGIILADAYGIPSAWLSSDTPKGLEFKFYDYFISVSKLQKSQHIDFSANELSWDDISRQIEFNDSSIVFDDKKLLRACPFISLD